MVSLFNIFTPKGAVEILMLIRSLVLLLVCFLNKPCLCWPGRLYIAGVRRLLESCETPEAMSVFVTVYEQNNFAMHIEPVVLQPPNDIEH